MIDSQKCPGGAVSVAVPPEHRRDFARPRMISPSSPGFPTRGEEGKGDATREGTRLTETENNASFSYYSVEGAAQWRPSALSTMPSTGPVQGQADAEGSANQPPTKRRRGAQSDNAAAGEVPEEEVPACQSCRKRKAKCSREQPCSVCERLGTECLYDDRRQRPGLRTGAVEALNQRVASLEQMILGQAILLRPLLLAGSAGQLEGAPSSPAGSFSETASALKCFLSTAASDGGSAGVGLPSPCSIPAPAATTSNSSDHTDAPPHAQGLPSNWRQLVELYFDQVHKWIPVLHVRNFRRQLEDTDRLGSIDTILHAITSICLRRCPPSSSSDSGSLEQTCINHRRIVMIRSMETFSVENLQASIIVAFDTVSQSL